MDQQLLFERMADNAGRSQRQVLNQGDERVGARRLSRCAQAPVA